MFTDFDFMLPLELNENTIAFGDTCIFFKPLSPEGQITYGVKQAAIPIGYNIYPYAVLTPDEENGSKVLRCFYLTFKDPLTVLHFDWEIGSSIHGSKSINVLDDMKVQTPQTSFQKIMLANALDIYAHHKTKLGPYVCVLKKPRGTEHKHNKNSEGF
jgi:hypothetical protein